jgi:hypothetical protein
MFFSDRHVLYSSGSKIPGTVKNSKSNQISKEGEKPVNGHLKRKTKLPALRFLKWGSEVIATIDSTNAVTFLKPDYNAVVVLYTHGLKAWKPEKFYEFLAERVVSRDRREH